MGLFSDIGRKVERFKQTVEEEAASSADYQCGDCETRLQTDHEACPVCGAEAVQARDDESDA